MLNHHEAIAMIAATDPATAAFGVEQGDMQGLHVERGICSIAGEKGKPS